MCCGRGIAKDRGAVAGGLGVESQLRVVVTPGSFQRSQDPRVDGAAAMMV